MIKIEINCEPDFLDAHIRALGFMRNPTAALGAGAATSPLAKLAEEMRNGTAKFVGPNEDAQTKSIFTPSSNGEVIVETVNGVVESVTVVAKTGAGVKANPDRPWGQPSPGKKRRSGAEVAEDEAYYAAHANGPPVVTNTPRAAEAAISTGAERVDPQDAADEAAETAARQTGKFTMEDVRRAVGVWSEKVGPADAIKKLRDILGGYALIDLPEAEYSKAIDNLEWAAANPDSKVLTVPNGKAPELKVEDPPKEITKEDVLVAIIAYGARYDGSKDPEMMPLTKEDLPKVFGKVFGKDVTGLGSMPKTPEAFGQITAAIVAATRDNPFRREVQA